MLVLSLVTRVFNSILISNSILNRGPDCKQAFGCICYILIKTRHLFIYRIYLYLAISTFHVYLSSITPKENNL
jgi:hypothetical protein